MLGKSKKAQRPVEVQGPKQYATPGENPLHKYNNLKNCKEENNLKYATKNMKQ